MKSDQKHYVFTFPRKVLIPEITSGLLTRSDSDGKDSVLPGSIIGKEVMMLKQLMRSVKTLVAAGLLMVTAAGSAYAVSQYPPEGGTWEYGTGWATGWAWSYYTHPSQGHGSSVSVGGLNSGTVVSLCARAGIQSKADKWRHPGASANYFYRMDSRC